jgi:hypothetical protein
MKTYSITSIAELETIAIKHQLSIEEIKEIVLRWQKVIFLKDYKTTTDLFIVLREYLAIYSRVGEKPIFADVDLNCLS